jgi:hypothetical protein
VNLKVLHAAAQGERLSEACDELPVKLGTPEAWLPRTDASVMARVATALASKRLVRVTEQEHTLGYWEGIAAVQTVANWSSRPSTAFS